MSSFQPSRTVTRLALTAILSGCFPSAWAAVSVCSTAPWTSETGAVQAIGSFTAPQGKKYEEDCALTVDAANPGFLTTEAPDDETLFATRFYFHADEMTLTTGDAAIFEARDGATTQVRLALRQVGDAQHLVVSYRSGDGIVEHGETFPTLPTWQAATVIWQAGGDTGRLNVKLDGRDQLLLENLDNGDELVNEMDMGLIDVQAATGLARFDAFHARRELPEPPLLAVNEVLNFSTRALVGVREAVVPGGFIVSGDTKKCVVIRGRGRSVALPDTPLLQDPNLTLIRLSDRQVLDDNDDWQDHPSADKILSLGAAPGDPADSAIHTCLEPGAYTATLRGKDSGGLGVGIVEVFDADQGTAHLYNISTRAGARRNLEQMVGGFVIGGTEPRTVLIRGRGPSVDLPEATLLADPVMVLKDGAVTIAENDDWASAANVQAIVTTGIAPANATDAAILITLAPGPYTVSLGSSSGDEGIGIIEVFDINGPTIEPNGVMPDIQGPQ